jgi:hypothetical protein
MSLKKLLEIRKRGNENKYRSDKRESKEKALGAPTHQ